MAIARTLGVALTGLAGQIVEVQADLSAGLPGLTFTGLPDMSVVEARDRIRAAVLRLRVRLAEPAHHASPAASRRA